MAEIETYITPPGLAWLSHARQLAYAGRYDEISGRGELPTTDL